jgi:hypothetical protein
MLCASQNLLAGKYEDVEAFPRGSAGHAARKEDTDNLFDGALESCDELIFYLSPLVDEWEVRSLGVFVCAPMEIPLASHTLTR